jgi:hypothetical protein
MRGCGFTFDESNDRTLEARVRRWSKTLQPKRADKNGESQPPNIPLLAAASAPTVPNPPNPPAANDADDTPNPPQGPNDALRALLAFDDAPHAKTKTTRRTSLAAQQERVNRKAAKKKVSEARKMSSRLWAAEKQKKEAGEDDFMTIDEVIETVRQQYGTAPSAPTIYQDVKEGRIGLSPKKTGGGNKIPQDDWILAMSAFVSLVKINQLNNRVEDNTQAKLGAKIANVFAMNQSDRHLITRMLKDTAIDLMAAKMSRQEHRRILWNTYRNLELWFNNWEANLLRLGFAYVEEDTNLVQIRPELLHRFVNIDETALSLDGSNGQRGGRPETTLMDPTLPNPGTATSKSNSCSTMITGSSAAGEAVPPHFQFPTKSQSAETERLNIEAVAFSHTVTAKFGHQEPKAFSCTFGLNLKGGMTDQEFLEYIENNFMPLFPDMKDEPGLRVILKVDSGVGRDFLWLLARTRLRGLYIYPGEKLILFNHNDAFS